MPEPMPEPQPEPQPEPMPEPSPEVHHDFIIVGGGASGVMAAYKIATANPDKDVLVLESNSYSLDDYKSAGYDNIYQWRAAQQDSSFNYAFLGGNGNTIWLGKGLGGGTLHFGLQYIDQDDIINKNHAQFHPDSYYANKFFDDVATITGAEKYTYSNAGTKLPNQTYFDLKQSIDASSTELNMDFYNNKVYSK